MLPSLSFWRFLCGRISRIRSILKDIVYRRYLHTGDGGFFPAKFYTTKDYRQMELLTQMNNYLAENYDIC